jgi:hypothetical protein
LLLRHVALIGEQVVLADFVRFSNMSGLVIEYVIAITKPKLNLDFSLALF